MHAVVTTLALTAADIGLARWGLPSEVCQHGTTSGNRALVMAGYSIGTGTSGCNDTFSTSIVHQLTSGGVSCVCSGHSNCRSHYQTGESLLKHYNDNTKMSGQPMGEWYRQLKPMHHSCLLIDATSAEVWLLSDNVGAVPMWYSFSHTQSSSTGGAFIGTTDAISAARLGFFELNSLAPNHVMRVDTVNNAISLIDSLEDKSAIDAAFVRRDVEAHALRLYSSALSSLVDLPDPSFNRGQQPVSQLQHLKSLGGDRNRVVVVEADPAEVSSLLLSCALGPHLRALNVSLITVLTPSLVTNGMDQAFHRNSQYEELFIQALGTYHVYACGLA
jgi:hypothetical protein